MRDNALFDQIYWLNALLNFRESIIYHESEPPDPDSTDAFDIAKALYRDGLRNSCANLEIHLRAHNRN